MKFKHFLYFQLLSIGALAPLETESSSLLPIGALAPLETEFSYYHFPFNELTAEKNMAKKNDQILKINLNQPIEIIANSDSILHLNIDIIAKNIEENIQNLDKLLNQFKNLISIKIRNINSSIEYFLYRLPDTIKFLAIFVNKNSVKKNLLNIDLLKLLNGLKSLKCSICFFKFFHIKDTTNIKINIEELEIICRTIYDLALLKNILIFINTSKLKIYFNFNDKNENPEHIYQIFENFPTICDKTTHFQLKLPKESNSYMDLEEQATKIFPNLQEPAKRIVNANLDQ